METPLKRGAVLFPGLILAFTAAMLALGQFHYHYSRTVFGFPLAAGLAVCLLCLIEIASAVRRREPKPLRPVEAPALSLASVAWLFALAAFLYALGFVFGAALYLLVCLRSNAFSWRLSLGTALASLAATWGLAINVLGIQLPLKPLWLG